jgi:hypothetical protein
MKQFKTLRDLEKAYLQADKRFDNKSKALEAQIAALEAEKSKMVYPHFLKFLEKLGEQLLPKVKGAVKFETYGPFGLQNECSIYWLNEKGKTIGGATFTSYGESYGIKDYSKNTKRFPKGSIGERNGGNYNTIELTEDMNMDWFIKFIRKKF